MTTPEPVTDGSLLRGITVLDASQGVAAPFAAELLAWQGARVVKLVGPGDWLAELDTGPASVGRCVADYVDTHKERVPVADEIALVDEIRRRVEAVDVLVVDWTLSRSAALGLDLRELCRSYPALVVVSVTGYGLSGPNADRPAAELTGYHAGGEGFLLPGGDVFKLFPDRPPVRGGRFLADFDAGLTGAVGALAALLSRRATSCGDLVDVSVQEVEIGNNRTTLCRAFFENEDFDRGYAGYDYAGVLKCIDGWICLRPSEERHWSQFCAVIARPDLAVDERFATRVARFLNNDALNAVLGEWTADRTQAEVRAALLLAGCPGGPYLDAAGVLGDAAIGSRGLIGGHPKGGRAPTGLMHVSARAGTEPGRVLQHLRGAQGPGRVGGGPLAGLRVLDLTWVAAGPYATGILGFMGAEVLKIESRLVPDLFRRSLADPSGNLDANIRFADLNQGKKSVSINLKSAQGRQLVLELAEQCDVLLENYRPGVRERLGIGDAALHRRNPQLAIVALSGFGATAIDAARPGYASIFSAESGLSAMTGYPDAPPADIRDSNDLRTGTAGALAALTALLAQASGYRNISVDAAARDVLIALQGESLLQASRGGAPTRSGNQLADCVPYDCYRSADGWVAVAVRTRQEWRGLVKAIPALDLRDLDTNSSRIARRTEIDAALALWCADRDGAAAVQRLTAAGVPAAVSASASVLKADEHLLARGFLRSADHPVLGGLLLVGSPLRLVRSEVVEGRRPPLLGEHTDEVLRDLLGRDEQEIATLRASHSLD